MNGEWCYFKSYFDKATCEKIIADAQSIPVQDAVIGTHENAKHDFDYRRSKIRFINRDNPNFIWLFDTIWKTAIEANRDFFNIQISKLDYIQLAEYRSTDKGEYKEHHDVFWMNKDPYYHRKLSGVIQLSDPKDYVGGQLEITEGVTPLDKDDTNQQGSIIYFPSMFRHKVTPVTKGTRYSIAVWFDGPKWR